MAKTPWRTPTIELAFERFGAEWPVVWLVYGVGGPHRQYIGWKDQQTSSVFARVDLPSGRTHYREYRVRAVKQNTAIDRVAELTAAPFPVAVTIYRFTPPPTAEQVAYLEGFNAKLQRERDGRGSTGDLGTGSRDRAGRELSTQRPRRRVSIGL